MRTAALTLGLLACLGCHRPVWVEVTPLGSSGAARTPSKGPVDVLAQAPQNRTYDTLGLIHLRGFDRLQALISEAQTRAQGLGADAIILQNSTIAVGDRMAELSVVAIHYR